MVLLEILEVIPIMTFVDILTYIGIFVFAMTGALKARDHHMDIFGAIVLAFLTSYGGGTVRDLILRQRPVWMNDYLALGLVTAATMSVFLFKIKNTQMRKTIFITDAIGLGLFTVAGIERALANGANQAYALILGVVTATFGGLIADILCNTVPSLMRRGELYATACAIGGVVYLITRYFVEDSLFNLIFCVILTILLRVVSKWKRLMLPSI